MNLLYWKHTNHLAAGTTLRQAALPEQNNTALHTIGDKEAILQNRKVLCDSLGISLTQATFAQQTHSDHMCEVTKADIGRGSMLYQDGFADCDALYTKEKNALIGVFHADCVAVLLYDPIKEIIMAIHSGWQGTTKEITRKCVEQLVETEAVDPNDLQAYIAPAINFESLEVGNEVVDLIKTMSFDTSAFITRLSDTKAFIDNKGLNRQMLIQAGVKAEHILVNPSDTFQPNESLFSYRRDHNCGRHMSFIMMRD